MTDYPSAITVLPDPLKKKRMRLNVTGLKHREIEHLKQNVVILRGDAHEMMHRALQSRPRGIAREKAPLCSKPMRGPES